MMQQDNLEKKKELSSLKEQLNQAQEDGARLKESLVEAQKESNRLSERLQEGDPTELKMQMVEME